MFVSSASGSEPKTNEYPLSWCVSVFCVVVLALSYVTNAMDRLVFSMLLPWVTSAYGYDLQSAGLLATIFTLGIGLSSYPIGRMIDKYSRKTTLLIGMTIYSVFTFATVLSFGFWDMLIYRLMTGVGEAMQIAALLAAVGSYFYKHKGKALGFINMGYAVGAFIGPLLGTKLTMATNNWHTPFWIYAILGLIFVGIVGLFVPKEFMEAKGPSASSNGQTIVKDNVSKEFWNRNVILICLGIACFGLSGYAILGLYPTYMIKVLKIAPVAASVGMGLFGCGAILGAFAGWLGDRYGQKRVIIISWICSIINGYFLFNIVSQAWQANIGLFLVGAFGSAAIHPNGLSIMQRSVQPDMVGRATGTFTASIFIAAALAGLLFGGMAQALGWATAGTILSTALGILAIILTYFVREDKCWQY